MRKGRRRRSGGRDRLPASLLLVCWRSSPRKFFAANPILCFLRATCPRSPLTITAMPPRLSMKSSAPGGRPCRHVAANPASNPFYDEAQRSGRLHSMMTMVFFRVRPAADRPRLATAPARPKLLDPATADQIVDQAAFAPGELVIEIGAGSGALTRALVRRAQRVSRRRAGPNLGETASQQTARLVFMVSRGTFWLSPFPASRFASSDRCRSPGRRTSFIACSTIRRSPCGGADVIVQWEVAVERAATPPVTLVSTAWAPW